MKCRRNRIVQTKCACSNCFQKYPYSLPLENVQRYTCQTPILNQTACLLKNNNTCYQAGFRCSHRNLDTEGTSCVCINPTLIFCFKKS